MIKSRIFIQIAFMVASVLPSEFLISQDSNDVKTYSEDLVRNDSVYVGCTAVDVFENYLAAIGGRENFAKVKDRTIIMRGDLSGQNVSTIIKQKIPNLLHQEVNLGELQQTIIFDGTRGVRITGDQQSEIIGDELERFKVDAAMDFLLDPGEYGATIHLVNNEMVDSIKCNCIEITTSAGIKWKQYYDTKTKLLVKEIKDVPTPYDTLLQETYVDDYREVDGLKFPFRYKQSLGNQSINWKVIDIKLDSGLKDSLFVIPE